MSNCPAPPACRVAIRWLIHRDLSAVLDIESASFSHPWDESDFLRTLRRRNCIGMVAESTDGSEMILGFMLYDLHPTHITVLDFAVHPNRRREGIGRQMAGKLVGKLSGHRRTRVLVSVPETLTQAQLFFRAMGFLATEVMREGCEATGEDVYLMSYELAVGSDVACEADGSRATSGGSRP